MEKTEKDMLTDIILDNHEEEFRIIETGDDGGAHFALYLPEYSKFKEIKKLIEEKKFKKRVIVISTPTGYIGSILK